MKLTVNILLVTASIIFSTAAADEQHIYLSRHAEKVQGVKDPGLTQKGKVRAKWLAEYLKDKNINMIYSTDYKRTRDTANPFAKLTHKSVVLYDPRKLADFAKQVLADGKNSFIAGHSNTTPELVKFLGGNPGEVMSEKDYDRLYHLTVDEHGIVKTEETKSLPQVSN